MKKNLKNFLGIIIITCFLILPFLVFAQEEGEAGDYIRGINQSLEISSGNNPLSALERIGGGAGYQNVSLPIMLGLIVNTALSLLGIVFVILIVLGGYKWLTAGGDEKDVSEALSYIKRAIIGLVITLSAWAIWLFIASRLT